MASDRSDPFEGYRPYQPPPRYQVTARRGHSSGRSSTTTPPPGLKRKTKKPLLFISEKPSFFFSEGIIWAVERGNPYFARINFPRRFVRVMLQRVHHEKYICFPAALPSKTAEGRHVDLLQPFVSLAWQRPLCQCKCGGAPPPQPPRSLPVLLTIEMSPWQLE